MALSPTRAQSLFASPGKRKRDLDDSLASDVNNAPFKSRNAGGLHSYPLLLAQQAATDEHPFSQQTSVTGKFQNLAIRENGAQTTFSSSQLDREGLAALDVDSSPTNSSSLLKELRMSSEITKPGIQPPSASSFEFGLPSTVPSESVRRQSRSPPLNGEPHDNFWHDSEITGHNPTDPDDDLVGINGIGFKPTPAIAWVRSQKRKQQLADYKTRETREARQRRIERRRVPSNLESEKENEDGRSTKIRVRFEDG